MFVTPTENTQDAIAELSKQRDFQTFLEWLDRWDMGAVANWRRNGEKAEYLRGISYALDQIKTNCGYVPETRNFPPNTTHGLGAQ